MPFSLEQWKQQLSARWQQFAADPRGTLNAVAANSTYFAMAGMALYPIAQALAQRDYAALVLLGQLGAGVGVNLIANAVQDWVNESDAVVALQKQAKQPEVVAALDAVLAKLEAVPEVQRQLTPADRAWFEQTLQAELQRLGSTLQMGVITNSGAGAVATAHSTAAGQGGAAVKGDVLGDVVIDNSVRIVLGHAVPTAAQRDQLTQYLHWLRNKCRAVPLAALDREKRAKTVTLEQVFIELNSTVRVPKETLAAIQAGTLTTWAALTAQRTAESAAAGIQEETMHLLLR